MPQPSHFGASAIVAFHASSAATQTAGTFHFQVGKQQCSPSLQSAAPSGEGQFPSIRLTSIPPIGL